MNRLIRFASCALTPLLMSVPAPSAAADPAKSAEPVTPLYELLSPEDYPLEAVRNREEGTVTLNLSINPDGRVTNCSVASSSGSPSIDATSCRLLVGRSRFKPATDARGRAVADTYIQRITWRLPNDIPPRLAAALDLWTACLMGEVAKLSMSSLPNSDIRDRAFQSCAPLEALFASESAKSAADGADAAASVASVKEQFRTEILPDLEKSRSALQAQKR